MAKIDTLFRYLIATKGSDLHLSEGQVPKIRVHGAVVNIPDQETLAGDSFRDLLAEICDAKAFKRYLEDADLDFAYEMDENSRFRCNYLKQQNGLAAVFRLIPTEIASLESLGVPEVVKEFGHMLAGLVLNPFSGELFSAQAGRGARLNGKPIGGDDDARCRR